MGIVLLRVDERLIHGQVTVGWGTELGLGRYVVIDDELPGRSLERDLYGLGVPDDAVAEFRTVAEAADRLGAWDSDAVRTALLTRDLDHMVRLAAGRALEGRTVNLGGLHHAPGRSRVLSYLFLGEEDFECLRGLRGEGVSVVAQDLPGSRRVRGREILRG